MYRNRRRTNRSNFKRRRSTRRRNTRTMRANRAKRVIGYRM